MVSAENFGAMFYELFGLCNGFVKAASCSIGVEQIAVHIECFKVFRAVEIDALF